MLVTLKQTIVAILMAWLVELGATQWTKIQKGSIVVFLHVKPKMLMTAYLIHVILENAQME